MSSPSHIQGNWKGQFRYGKQYSRKSRRRRISFTLFIENIAGQLRGFFRDEISEKLFGKAVEIKGVQDGSLVKFIKKNPGLAVIGDQDEMAILEGQAPLDIQFTGKVRRPLFSRKLMLTGTWLIQGKQTNSLGLEKEFNYSGTWKAVMMGS